VDTDSGSEHGLLSHKKSERREQINVNNIVLPVVTPAAPRRAAPDSPPPSCVIMEVLLTAEELAAGIGRLSAAVRQVVGRRPLTVVGVLTGSIVLVSDLIRRLEGPVQVSMVWASSYRGTATAAGALELRLDLLPDLTGQEVLLVDDIFDTGRTLEALMQELRRRGAACVRSLVLLRKAGRAEVAIQSRGSHGKRRTTPGSSRPPRTPPARGPPPAGGRGRGPPGTPAPSARTRGRSPETPRYRPPAPGPRPHA
jgi:hypoxanthine phosphoribosyltransferase